MDFYEILNVIMKNQKLTISEVSDLTGVSHSTLSSILTRKTKDISLSNALKISQGLHIPLESLSEDTTANTKLMNPDSNIQYIIKNKRKELGLTYEQLGHKIGVGKSTVRKWETGQIKNIGISNVIAIAKAFNMTSNELLEYNSLNADTDLTIYLKSLIQNTGLSMRAFSQKAEIPYTSLISILSRGINNTSILNILKICKVLKITVEELYSLGSEIDINNYKLEKLLLKIFSNLNHIGKLELVKRAEELSELSKYR